MTELPRIITIAVLLALVGCAKPTPEVEPVPAKPEVEPAPAEAKPEVGVQIANPASVNCEQKGGKLEIVTAPDGGQSGMCVLPDGTRCEEWAYMRGECPKP